jgi:hypothetical protein
MPRKMYVVRTGMLMDETQVPVELFRRLRLAEHNCLVKVSPRLATRAAHVH